MNWMTKTDRTILEYTFPPTQSVGFWQRILAHLEWWHRVVVWLVSIDLTQTFTSTVWVGIDLAADLVYLRYS
jgi:hypothetical protein